MLAYSLCPNKILHGGGTRLLSKVPFHLPQWRSQSYKVERIEVRKATVCWPARKPGYRSLAPSASRQGQASSDGNDFQNGLDGSGHGQQKKGIADSHALGPSQGIVVLGLRVRDHNL